MIVRRLYLTLSTVLAAVSFAACQPADRPPSGAARSDSATGSTAAAHVFDVIARDYAFVAAAEIPSGWTTFRLKNEGMEHHFLFLSRLPEGRTFGDYVAQVGVAFDSVWHELRRGAVDKAEAGVLVGRLLPDWYAAVTAMGGPGLVAPGGVAETTVKLEPGNYVMECYVKTPDGEFHVMLGMARPLTVTSEVSTAVEPTADLELTLSNHGMETRGDVRLGKQTIAVHFAEHPEYGLGNDIHLVRLEDGTDMAELVQWMDWMNLDGLRAPAPASFVGGAQEMPVGYTAYFTIDLTPGRYAWISELATDESMVEDFTLE